MSRLAATALGASLLVASCGGAKTEPVVAHPDDASASPQRRTREPTTDQLTCHDGFLPELDAMPEAGSFGVEGLHFADPNDWVAWNEKVERTRRANDGRRRCGTPGATAVCGAPGVSGRRGRAIAEAACPLTPSVRACYDAARKAMPALAGTFPVALTIDATGIVTSAKAVGSTVDDVSFAGCVEKVFTGARFPAGAQEVIWTLTVQEPERHPHTVKMIEFGTDIQGRLPPEVIKRIVRANFARFRACYEQGLKRDPKIAGVIKVAFTIDEHGDVEGARHVGGTLQDDAVVACVTERFSKLSFPPPERGTVKVVYPIDYQYEP